MLEEAGQSSSSGSLLYRVGSNALQPLPFLQQRRSNTAGELAVAPTDETDRDWQHCVSGAARSHSRVFSDSEGSSSAVSSHWTLKEFIGKPACRCIVLVMLWVSVGILFLHDKMGYVDMFYLLAQILTTVGYGDMPLPDTNREYIIFCLYAFSSTLLVAQTLAVFIGHLSSEHYRHQRHVQAAETSGLSFDRRFVGFLRGFAVWMFFVSTYAVFFYCCPGEQKGFCEAVYMAVVTLTTIGFGDVTPITDCGKMFATVWMIFGTSAFTNLMGKFALWTFFFFHKMSVEKLEAKSLLRILRDDHFERVAHARAQDIEQLLQDFSTVHDDSIKSEYAKKISRNDFLVFSLLDMGLVGEDMIEALSMHFDDLDVTGNGYIEKDDLERAQQLEEQGLPLRQLEDV